MIQSSVTLDEIDNVEDFVQHLERIELPNQLVAVIGDPLLQKFLRLKYSETTWQRIDNWLSAFFEDQLETSHSTTGNILDMLQGIREYARYTKVGNLKSYITDADNY
jgi:centromere protein I